MYVNLQNLFISPHKLGKRVHSFLDNLHLPQTMQCSNTEGTLSYNDRIGSNEDVTPVFPFNNANLVNLLNPNSRCYFLIDGP